MKRSVLLLVAGLSLVVGGLHAEPVCRVGSIEKAVEQLQKAYGAKRLGELDALNLKGESVQFVIEHSLSSEYEVEEHKSFALAEGWLSEQEVEPGMPTRKSTSVSWCKSGMCLFEYEEGIAHNHLYLDKVIYGYQDKCPVVRSVFLLDGD